MSKFLVYLLVCLSLHACSTARPLATIDQESRILISAKDVLTFLTRDLLKTQGKITSETDGSSRNGDDANFMQQKRSNNVSQKEVEDENKGQEVNISFEKEAQMKMMRRQSRLILESAPSAQHEEEAVSSIEKGPVEDVVVMDYAQPHRKPPIHNREH